MQINTIVLTLNFMNMTGMKEEKSNQKTVGEKSNKLNYKILALIGVLTIVDLIYGLYWFDGTHFDIKDGFYMAGLGTCAISGIIVAIKYRGSEMLGKAYAFLGIGFLAWFIGDSGYYYNQFVLEIDPWPSPFDAGFFLSSVFAILHLVLNTRYFKPNWSKSAKAIIIIIPVVIGVPFTLIAYDAWGEYDELLFDLGYTNLFITGTSVTLAFAIVGASVFRNSVLKETWLLLAIGIFLWTIADTIYVYLEVTETFTHNHPINSIWSLSFMVIIYALYKHVKAL